MNLYGKLAYPSACLLDSESRGNMIVSLNHVRGIKTKNQKRTLGEPLDYWLFFPLGPFSLGSSQLFLFLFFLIYFLN